MEPISSPAQKLQEINKNLESFADKADKNEFISFIKKFLEEISAIKLDCTSAGELNQLSNRLKEKRFPEKEIKESINKMKELAYNALNPKNPITIQNIPIDVQQMFLPNPPEVKEARLVSKNFKRAAENKMLDWLNSGNLIDSLKLAPIGIEKLLCVSGSRIKHFAIEHKNEDNVLKLIKHCTNICSLSLSNNNVKNCNLAFLAGFTQLKRLHLDICYPSDTSRAESLSSLTQLTHLDLGFNQINGSELGAHSCLAQLTHLDLQHNAISDLGVKSLSSFTQLTYLNLRHNRIGNPGVEALSSLAQLTYLDLECNQIKGSGLRALSCLAQLRNLRLSHNKIDAIELKALATLTQLEGLLIEGCRVDNVAMEALSSLVRLTSLEVSANDIDGLGTKPLTTLTQLMRLNLWHNRIGNPGVEALSSLAQLTYLDLGFNQINGQGVKPLSSLTQLRTLVLWGNPIGDLEVESLSPLTQLKSLLLPDTKIGDLKRKALQNALKNCDIAL